SGSPSWSQLTPLGTPPSARTGSRAIYDPVRDRMLVFGGTPAGNVDLNDVWSLTLSGSPAWTLLSPTGNAPEGREVHTAIYDPVRDRMLIFGGYAAVGNTALNDVWSLALSGTPAWSKVSTGAPPAARYHHTAIYDPIRDRMVVFGGGNTTGTLFND